jgi:hypothetical protein
VNDPRLSAWRKLASRTCLVLAAVSLMLAAILSVSWRNIFRAESFGARAADSLGDPGVARFVSDRLTDEVLRQAPQLLGARPIVRATLQGLLDTAPTRALVRRAARRAHQALFSESSRNIVLSIPDLDVVLRGALAQASPQLAAKVPPRLGPTLAAWGSSRQLDVIIDLWRLGRKQRLLSWILFFGVAPLAIAASIWISGDRSRALFHTGIAIGVAGFLTAAVVPAGRLVSLAVEDPAARAAVQGLWRTYLGALRQWGLFFGVFGILFASAGASVMDRFDLGRLGRFVSARATTTPAGRGLRIVWGASWILGGVLVALFPLEFVTGALVVLGAGAAFVGVRQIFLVLQESLPKLPALAHAPPARSRRVAVGAVIGVVALLGVAWAILQRPDAAPAIEVVDDCNGHPELCDRRVDEVAFAGAHNSMSNTTISDWMFPHHQAKIDQQLEDGIRVLLVDVHRGFPGAARIKTDLVGEKITQERLSETLGPEGVEAAERIRNRLVGVDEEHPKLYLCHGFCELGAYEFEPVLRTIRDFMVGNPSEVLIMVLEDYVTIEELTAAFASSGLDQMVYRGPAPPWPTLRELIDSEQRLIVFTESGNPGVEWLRPTIGNIQETPYHFVTPAEFSCRPHRGGTTGSLYQLNHWIQTTPAPKLSNAVLVNAFDVLMPRARQFVRERGHIPNIVAVDFYGTGDVFAVVDSLNGIGRTPAPGPGGL